MALGMRLMLEDPDLRAIPGYSGCFTRQTGNLAESLQRDLLGDVRREQLGDVVLQRASERKAWTSAEQRAVP